MALRGKAIKQKENAMPGQTGYSPSTKYYLLLVTSRISRTITRCSLRYARDATSLGFLSVNGILSYRHNAIVRGSVGGFCFCGRGDVRRRE